MAVFQVSLLQRWLAQEVRNILYYETAQESLSTAQLQELADDIRAVHVTHWPAASRSNDWQLYGIGVRRVDAEGYPGIDVGFTAGALAGTSTAENVPTQIALLVHGVSYVQKPNRVRSYWAGVTEGQIVDGIMNAAVQGFGLALAQNLDSLTIDGQAWERVSVQWAMSEDTPPQRLGYVSDWNVIDTYFVTSVPATQRRRRIGVGT